MEFSMENMCRTCMNEDIELFPVFSIREEFIKNNTFAEMLMTCTSVQVAMDDGLPECICHQCIKQLIIAFNFKKQTEQIDATLREITKNPGIEFIKEEVPETIEDIEEFICSDIKKETENNELDPYNNYEPTESDENEEYIEEYIDDSIIIEVLEDQGSLKENYTCDVCRKTFIKRGHLIKHKRQHCIYNLECLKCKIKFQTKLELTRHKKSHSKSFKCDLCEKEFRSAHGLGYHLKIHSGIKNYECPYENCNKKFTLKQALEKHISTHTNERNHLCSLCGKMYGTYDALHYHIKTHKGERPHLCMYCGKTFKQSCHLKSHMWIHNGIKPHVCKTCGKCYTSGHQLKKHLKKYCNAFITVKIDNDIDHTS